MRHKTKAMKEMDCYHEAKAALKEFAWREKRVLKSDKPAIRQGINDYADSLCKDFPHSLSDSRRAQFTQWLQSYACTLHPKD